MNNLSSLLKPYRRKLRIEALWKSIILGIAIGIIAAAVFLTLAKIITHTAHYQLALVTCAVVTVLITIIYYVIWYSPRWRYTTACVDALGLEERVTTMYTNEGNDSVISKLQKEDTLKELNKINPSQLKIRFFHRQMWAILLSIIIFGIAALLPVVNVNASDTSKLTEAQNKIIDELVTKLEEKVDGLEVKKDTREQLNNVIEDLKEDLPNYNTTIEKIARISKASDSINAILKSLITKDVIGAALARYEITKSLGRAIINGDIEAVETACEDLKNQFDNLADDAYKEHLKNLSESLNGAIELIQNAGVEKTDELYKAIETFAEDISDALDSLNQGNDVTDQVDEAIDRAMESIILALGVQRDYEDGIKEIKKLNDKAKEDLAALERGEIETSESQGNEEGSDEGESTPGGAQEQGGTQPSDEGTPSEGEEGEGTPQGGAENFEGEVPGGKSSGGDYGKGGQEKVLIYDPEDGIVPYENVYDEYYANELARMNQNNTNSDEEDIVKGYFNLLK